MKSRPSALCQLLRDHVEDCVHRLLEQIDVLRRCSEDIIPNEIVSRSVSKLGGGAKRGFDRRAAPDRSVYCGKRVRAGIEPGTVYSEIGRELRRPLENTSESRILCSRTVQRVEPLEQGLEQQAPSEEMHRERLVGQIGRASCRERVEIS